MKRLRGLFLFFFFQICGLSDQEFVATGLGHVTPLWSTNDVILTDEEFHLVHQAILSLASLSVLMPFHPYFFDSTSGGAVDQSLGLYRRSAFCREDPPLTLTSGSSYQDEWNGQFQFFQKVSDLDEEDSPSSLGSVDLETSVEQGELALQKELKHQIRTYLGFRAPVGNLCEVDSFALLGRVVPFQMPEQIFQVEHVVTREDSDVNEAGQSFRSYFDYGQETYSLISAQDSFQLDQSFQSRLNWSFEVFGEQFVKENLLGSFQFSQIFKGEVDLITMPKDRLFAEGQSYQVVWTEDLVSRSESVDPLYSFLEAGALHLLPTTLDYDSSSCWPSSGSLNFEFRQGSRLVFDGMKLEFGQETAFVWGDGRRLVLNLAALPCLRDGAYRQTLLSRETVVQ